MYKKYYVRITRLAEQNLENILNYIDVFSLSLSFKIQKAFYKKLILLEQFPRMYRALQSKENSKKEYRSFVINKYMFIYTVKNETVRIIKVVPCKSNYKRYI